MVKYAMIWIGTTLELSAVIAFLGALLIGGPAADQVLMTLAVILLVNGASLQFLSAEFKKLPVT